MAQILFSNHRLDRYGGAVTPLQASAKGDTPSQETPAPPQTASQTDAPKWSSRTLRRWRKDPPIAAMARDATLPGTPII